VFIGKMGGSVSVALEETKKRIATCLEKKEDIVGSVEVKNAIAALTIPDLSLLVAWGKEKNTDVLLVVASIYEAGSATIPKNLVENFVLTKFVADKTENHRVFFKLATLYRDGAGVAVNLDEMKAYIEKAAALFNSEALTWLGVQYDNGTNGYAVDHVKSVAYYLDAFKYDPNARVACYNMGCHFYEGDAVGLSYYTAYEWFERAAKLGDVDALMQLAMMNYFGQGCPKHLTKAADLYKEVISIDPKNSKAMYQLSVMYQKVFFDEKNHVFLLEQSAALNNPEALNALGLEYLTKNEEKGIHLLIKAGELGFTFASYNLAMFYKTKPGKQFIALKYFNVAYKKFVNVIDKTLCSTEMDKLIMVCKGDLLALLDKVPILPIVTTEEPDTVHV